jgi:hypothetical protein
VVQDTGTDTGVVDPDVATSEDTGTIVPDTGQPGPDTCTGQNCEPADTGPKLDRKLNATGPSNGCACGASPRGVPLGALSLAMLGLAGMFVRRRGK